MARGDVNNTNITKIERQICCIERSLDNLGTNVPVSTLQPFLEGTTFTNNDVSVAYSYESPTPFVVQPVAINSTFDIYVKGGNFDTNTIFAIPSVTVNSTTFLNDRLVLLNITTGGSIQNVNITASNSGVTNSGSAVLSISNVTTLVPGFNTAWANLFGGVTTTDGEIEGTNIIKSWNGKATFGTVPAGKDFVLEWYYNSYAGGSGANYGVVGFDENTPNPNPPAYLSTNYAVYCNGTNFSVNELGVSYLNLAVNGPSIKYEIRRQAGVVTYWSDGILRRTSPTLSVNSANFVATLYSESIFSGIKVTWYN